LSDHLSRFFIPEGSNNSKEFINNKRVEKSVQITKRSNEFNEFNKNNSYIEPNEEIKKELLLKHHLLGHYGIESIVKNIRIEGYNWKNIKNKAKEIVEKCLPCLRFNIHKIKHHQLYSIIAHKPFDHVAIDLTGPFPTSRNNNHYIHVLIDIHSRFVILTLIKDKTAETLAQTWLQIFLTFGFPMII